MFVIANLLVALAQVLDFALYAYSWILLARVVVSYVNPDPGNPLIRFLYNATEPVLRRVRARLPAGGGAFDWAPIVVWLAVLFVQRFVVRSLVDLAQAIH